MTDPNKSKDILKRKIDHLKIPLEYNVQHSENYFNDVHLIHHPLPEMDFDDVDLSVEFFGKKISAPICIAAMTGGHQISKDLNQILAKAASAENIIMSVGSQRSALENPNLEDSFSIVREVAPDIPIIGNLGLGQVSKYKFKIDKFNNCIEMINADVMAIHMNSLHELVQDKGDLSYKLFDKNFEELRNCIDIPIIGKEVGSGFNQDSARRLESLGFNGFDVGGSGGTSFVDIEFHRENIINEKFTRNPAKIFREWGNPTPLSVMNVRSVSKLPLIATGGLRTGIDIAKSIVLGADIGGFAFNFLQSAWKDHENGTISETIKEIKTLKHELQSSMWLMNINCVKDLKSNTRKRVYLGKLYQWIEQMSFHFTQI